MKDIKFALRMTAAFVVIVLILHFTQKWDEADSQRLRISMMART